MSSVLSIDYNIPIYSKVEWQAFEDNDKIQLNPNFSNLLIFGESKIHERMLFESAKLYAVFLELLYTYIFYIENVKIESRSLFVYWYYLFSYFSI